MFALFHTHRHAVKIKCINKLFPGYQKMLSMYIKHIDCNDPDKDLGVDKISFRSQCFPPLLGGVKTTEIPNTLPFMTNLPSNFSSKQIIVKGGRHPSHG